MTNQDYLRGAFFGAGLPVQSVRPLRDSAPSRIEYESGDFSFLLKLEELQRSRQRDMEDVNETELAVFDNQQLAHQDLHHTNLLAGFSLEEFERDMDLLAEGLEHLPLQYRGTFSREDIYMDDE